MVVYHHKKHDINDDKDHIKNDLELAGTLVAQQAYLDPTANYGVVWGVYGSSITGQLTYNFTNSRFEFTDDVYAPNFIGNGSQLTNITAEALNLSPDEWLYFNYPTNTIGIRYASPTTSPPTGQIETSWKFYAPNITSGNAVNCNLLYTNYEVIGSTIYSPGMTDKYFYMVNPSTNKVTYVIDKDGGIAFHEAQNNGSFIEWFIAGSPSPVTIAGIGTYSSGGVNELEIYTNNGTTDPIQMYSITNLWEDTALQDGKYLFFDTARTKSLWYDGVTDNRFEFNDAVYMPQLMDGGTRLKNFMIANNSWLGFGTGNFTLVYTAADSRIANTHTGTAGGSTGNWRFRIRIPDDFSSFPTNAVTIDTYRSGAPTAFTVTIYLNGTADSTISAWSVTPTANTTWESKQSTPGSTYAAGDFITVQVNSQVGNGIVTAFDKFTLKYNAKIGG